jgi:hypothetical protein
MKRRAPGAGSLEQPPMPGHSELLVDSSGRRLPLHWQSLAPATLVEMAAGTSRLSLSPCWHGLAM